MHYANDAEAFLILRGENKLPGEKCFLPSPSPWDTAPTGNANLITHGHRWRQPGSRATVLAGSYSSIFWKRKVHRWFKTLFVSCRKARVASAAPARVFLQCQWNIPEEADSRNDWSHVPRQLWMDLQLLQNKLQQCARTREDFSHLGTIKSLVWLERDNSSQKPPMCGYDGKCWTSEPVLIDLGAIVAKNMLFSRCFDLKQSYQLL